MLCGVRDVAIVIDFLYKQHLADGRMLYHDCCSPVRALLLFFFSLVLQFFTRSKKSFPKFLNELCVLCAGSAAPSFSSGEIWRNRYEYYEMLLCSILLNK